MRPHLPLLVRQALLAGLLSAGLIPHAHAAIRHSDVSMTTYVDFATNSGRYTTGATNELLEHLRRQEGGVSIHYTGGQASYTLPHGMISFDSVADLGNATALGYNYIVTVKHNARLSPTFTAHDWGIGESNCIRYTGIEEGDFTHESDTDYKITRLSKLVTDAAPATLYTPPITDGKTDMTGTLIYRIGGGLQQLADKNGQKTDISQAGTYNVAGIATISQWSDSGDSKTAQVIGSGKDGSITYDSGGVSSTSPLPFGSTEGDSGSPYFVWNPVSEQYELLMAHTGSYSGNPTVAAAAPNWTLNTMDSDNAYVDMGLTSDFIIVLKGAEKADDKDSGITNNIGGSSISVIPSIGYVYTSKGENLHDNNWNYTTYQGVDVREGSEDTHTWKSLSGLKNTDNWYNYGNEYLNATDSIIHQTLPNGEKVTHNTTGLTYSELYQTQNLVFRAAKADTEHTIRIDADTDLGLGYLHFTAEKLSGVSYKIESENNHQLNSAGYVVDKGVTVNVTLRNTHADYMREWRKVGEGTLTISGTGNNEIFLNIGGSGKTILAQEKGYAAYNVLVNSGSTLVINDTGQIARDLTFGSGGGTLELQGNQMDWYTTGGETREGSFTIRALTEEAVITNSTGAARLTYREGDTQSFLGSFTDTKDASLTIDYQGCSPLILNSIRTRLINSQSGLIVSDGTVRLEGTLTVHGYGTTYTADTADFTTRENDWHYADAAMNVTVKKEATFELGSHARLTGQVMVESGGTYVMHEGVQHAEEHVEGGEKTNNTAALSDYYGHKGNVTLQEGAVMEVRFSDTTDTAQTHEGSISGDGKLNIRTGSKAQLHVTGDIDVGILTLAESSRLSIVGKLSTEELHLGSGAILSVQGGGILNAQQASITLSAANTTTTDTTTDTTFTLHSYGSNQELTLEKGSRILRLQSSALSGATTFNGKSLSLQLDELVTMTNEFDAIYLSFSEMAHATGPQFVENLNITATLANGQRLYGYYSGNDRSTIYLAAVPEPTATALSLLALLGLSLRRRRK